MVEQQIDINIQSCQIKRSSDNWLYLINVLKHEFDHGFAGLSDEYHLDYDFQVGSSNRV